MTKQIPFQAQASAAALIAVVVLGSAMAQSPTAPKPGAQKPAKGAPAVDPRAWMDAHKHVNEVRRIVRDIEKLEESPTTALNKRQANAILAILTKYRTVPVMTDKQAVHVAEALLSPLTATQKVSIATMPQRGGPGGGPGGWHGGWQGRPGGPDGDRGPRGGSEGGPGRDHEMGGPGGPGGGGHEHGFGGPGGHGPFAFKEYNPLNPDSMPMERMRARSLEHLNELIAVLKATK